MLPKTHVAKYNKFSDLKQQKFILSQFWRPRCHQNHAVSKGTRRESVPYLFLNFWCCQQSLPFFNLYRCITLLQSLLPSLYSISPVYLSLHSLSSVCIYLCASFTLPKTSAILDYLPYWPYFNLVVSANPYFQIRSCSEIQGLNLNISFCGTDPTTDTEKKVLSECSVGQGFVNNQAKSKMSQQGKAMGKGRHR